MPQRRVPARKTLVVGGLALLLVVVGLAIAQATGARSAPWVAREVSRPDATPTDLVLERWNQGMYWVESSPGCGRCGCWDQERAGFRATIVNRGPGAAGPFDVVAQGEGATGQASPERIQGLAPGETIEVWFRSPSGWRGVIVVDPGHEVPDSDRSNNERPYFLVQMTRPLPETICPLLTPGRARS